MINRHSVDEKKGHVSHGHIYRPPPPWMGRALLMHKHALAIKAIKGHEVQYFSISYSFVI